MHFVDDVKLLNVPVHLDDGALAVFEEQKDIPINIARVFVVNAPAGAVRGNHAHKACTQVLVCVSGRCDVDVDDGQSQRSFVLDEIGKALLIPPSLWASQVYKTENACLMVLCDMGYDPEDYIRERPEYDRFRSEKLPKRNT